MNRVTKRTWIVGLFLAALIVGLGMFVFEYFTKASTWVSASGSPHIYHNGNLGCGTVVDRSGKVLLDIGDSRVYADDPVTRMSTMHWLGDRKGFINAAAVSSHAGDMAGFDIINGVYDYSGVGGTQTLTLSSRIQNAALNALDGQRGTIGIYNYKTGEILCAVTSPTFDPDNMPDISADTSGAYEGVYLNRFLQSTYVPGSIFKVVTTAAALECVPDIEQKTFSCFGSYSYGTEKVTCETAHGYLNLKMALAHSCNCCFAQIAELVGKQNMEKYVAQFLVTEPLEFDGVTCARGNYDTAKTGAASFAWSCIGQHTDLINPCRYMTFMGAIASGGEGTEPFLVSQVTSGEDTTYTASVQKTGRLMSETTARKLKEYMRNNVQAMYGEYRFPGLNACAKSGTSQLGGGLRSNAMFAGFLDHEDYPLAFIVVVENGGYGSATCVPILSKVLAECREVMNNE